MPAHPAVPTELHGVWRRSLLQTAGNAVVDTSTEVRWLQTPSAFGDIRVPAALLPCGGAALPPSLEAFDAAAADRLAELQSFAGHTVVTDDVSQWHREIDYQPPGGPADIGRMRWVHSEKLYEDDLEGMEYHEVWERLPESRGAAWALRLTSAAQGHAHRRAFLLVAGDCFLFCADRTGEPLPAVPGDAVLDSRLAAALRTLRVDVSKDDLAATSSAAVSAATRHALSFESCYGRVRRGADGAPAWRIELSTLPWRVGGALFGADVPTEGGAAALLDHFGGVPISVGSFPPPGGWACALDEPASDA